jgi:SAM-dependent methyltransferase
MNYGLLDTMALKYGADKCSRYHGYTRYYEFYLDRNNVTKILELGVNKGNSLKMWHEYFPNAIIYGIDIDKKCKKLENDRTKIAIGDCNDSDFINAFFNNNGNNFDLIIDDGSHNVKDQISFFNKAFWHLKSKGIFVIEDVLTSYIDKYGGNKQDSCIEFFKRRIDDISCNGIQIKKKKSNRDIILKSKQKDFSDYEKHIESIHFYSGLIVILKQ